MATTMSAVASLSPTGTALAGSHLHVQKIQSLTQGDVFVSQSKITKLRNFKTYAQALKIRGYRFEYYVNALFSPELVEIAKRRDDPNAPLGNQKREARFSITPGKRHDLTMDFEIQVLNAKGRWVKGRGATPGEKVELLAVLEKLPCIAWAGQTPGGCHAGIYFADWVEWADAELVADWVCGEVRRNGYAGPMTMDEGASKNCNRPSRFLPAFQFWRPNKKLGNAELKTIKYAASVMPKVKPSKGGKVPAGGSMYGLSERVEALFLRTYNVPDDEIAKRVGKPVSWVVDLFNELPQLKFNVFCRDLAREIGPRSNFGNHLAATWFRQKRTLLYINAALSWEWLWSQNISLPDAKIRVFTDPVFKPVLNEIETAFDESKIMNGSPHRDYATWQEWVERDLERCHAKFAGVSKKILLAVEAAVLAHGQPTIKIKDVLKAIPYKKTSAQTALNTLGMTASNNGRSSYWNVPMALIYSTLPPDILDALDWEDDGSTGSTAVVSAPPSSGSVSSVPVKAPAPPKPRKARKPRKKKLKPMDALLEIGQMDSLQPTARPAIDEKEMRKRLNADRRFSQLLNRVDAEYANAQKFTRPDDEAPARDLLLELVRAHLSADGHVYHESSHLYELLQVACGVKDFVLVLHWLLVTRHVLSVNAWVPDKGDWVGWADYVRGELRFAWQVIGQGAGGGSVEVISGAPGTGKTQTLADELLAARKAKLVSRVGSATHISAHQLRERMKKRVAVDTIHGAYNITPRKQKKRFVALDADVFAGDEMGQLDCDVAGQMAMAWAPGKRVLLTVGPGQNLPVGPGVVGENLVDWLTANPKVPGVKGTPLKKNYRTSNLLAGGIVEFFEHVHLGKLPATPGLGMEVLYLDNEFQVIQQAAQLAANMKDFMVFCPRHTDVFRVNNGISLLKRASAGILNTTIFDFHKGEEMVVVDAGPLASSHGIKNWSVVKVYQDTKTSGNPTDKIQVIFTASDGSKVVGWVTLGEVDWPWCRTGHASQGVECNTGIVVLTKSQVTNRRWLYTAVSRCRHKCILLCVRETLDVCLGNNPERHTLLPVFLDKAKELLSAP